MFLQLKKIIKYVNDNQVFITILSAILSSKIYSYSSNIFDNLIDPLIINKNDTKHPKIVSLITNITKFILTIFFIFILSLLV